MDKTLSVLGKNIQLSFTEHKIKLTNDEELEALVASDPEVSTDTLVAAIKNEYHQAIGRDINIRNSSMTVEIWGHIYAENFLTVIKSLPMFGLIDGLAEKLREHCEVIDIGEPGHDSNRFVWDSLSSFKSTIAGFLPKKSS
jgi:hypothetical protein